MAGKRGIPVKELFGGRFISPEAAQRSMAALEKRLDADFATRMRLRKQLAASPEKIAAPFLATDQFYAVVPSITWKFQPMWVVEAAP